MTKARNVCIFHGSDQILTGAFSPSGQVAATGGKGRLVSLWDTDGGEKVMTMPPHLNDVTAMRFKGDSSSLASGDSNGLLKIWDLREARLQRNLDGESSTKHLLNDSVLLIINVRPSVKNKRYSLSSVR